jgi:hypothetical protein
MSVTRAVAPSLSMVVTIRTEQRKKTKQEKKTFRRILSKKTDSNKTGGIIRRQIQTKSSAPLPRPKLPSAGKGQSL